MLSAKRKKENRPWGRFTKADRAKAVFLMKQPEIIHEEAVFLVVVKPPGMISDRQNDQEEKSLQAWLEKYFRLKDKGVGERAGLSHRLDKETSGLLLVAKTPEAHSFFKKQFKKRQVAKKYWALAHGEIKPDRGEIRARLSRHPYNRKKFGVFLNGREALTYYELKRLYQKDKKVFSFLELKPTTGRTHQLRVHLRYLGHPLVADKKYGGRKKALLDRHWCPRLFLHAFFLKFNHPVSGKKVAFTIPLPADLKKVLKSLDRLKKE